MTTGGLRRAKSKTRRGRHVLSLLTTAVVVGLLGSGARGAAVVTLTVTVANGAGGTIFTTEAKLGTQPCRSSCKYIMALDAPVILDEKADSGWIFASFSTPCRTAPCRLTITANTAVTATFNP